MTDVKAPSAPRTSQDSDPAGRRSSVLARGVRRWRGSIYPLITFTFLLTAWAVAIPLFDIEPYLLPSPWQVAEAIRDNWAYLIENTWPTLQIILGGYFTAVAVGIPLGVLIASSRTVERFIYPLLVVSQTVPKIAIAPVLVIWFGFGYTPKLFVTVVLAFFPITIMTASGLMSVPSDMEDLARSMRMRTWSAFVKIRFPAALPNVFAGLKSAITLAVLGAIVAEFVGTDRGLGYVLQIASGRVETDLVFGCVAFLVVIGMTSFVLIQTIERLAIPWHESVRKTGTRR